MKRSRRILAVVGVVIAILLVLLAVLPLFFRDRIAARAKAAVNQNVDARVNWSGVGLSFFRHFPNLTLTLDDLTTVGVGRFEGDTLAAVRHLQVVLSVGSVVGNVMSGAPIVVRAVELDQPRLHLLALEDGTANWDITKKAPETAPAAAPASKPLSVSLRSFRISDGAIAFENRQSKLDASLVGYDQSLSGDFSQRRVVIHTQASADTANVTFTGIPYLDRVKLGLTANIDADLAGKTYTVENTALHLNDLTLALSGAAKSEGTLIALDLKVNAPTTSFRSILSLVPAVYAHDFGKVQSAGTIALDGWVKGVYGGKNFPAFALTTTVNDASFKYSDLPLPARSIFVDLALTNPGGSADSTVVKLDRFHVVLGNNPIDAHLLLRTPVSDPQVDASVSGKVDLADLGRTVKLSGISQLTGTVAANASVRTRMSSIAKKQYEKVVASGSVDVAGVTMKGAALPHSVAVQQASLTLAPERAQLEAFTATVGSSDLQASGTLDNLLAFAFRDDTLRGSATVKSNHFDLDEWRSGGDLQIILVPPKIDFTLDASVAKLLYDKLEMNDAHAKLHIANQRATLDQFQTNTLGGQVAVTGYYETTHPDKPTFDVAPKLTNVDIPSAFKAFTTVQMLAPVAKYATGTASSDMHLTGALGKDMMPLFPTLGGSGTVQTSALSLHDFPALTKVADATKLQFLNNPTLQPLHATFRIENGRLSVKPFDVKVGGVTMNVAGSNGLDQSLQYTLGLHVPRALLGSAANQAISGIISKAGNAGVDLGAAPEIPLDIQIGGTVTSPTVKVNVQNAAASVAKGAEQAAQAAAQQKASAAAAQAVQAAEQKAAQIKQAADSLAAKVKQEGYRQADSLAAKAGTNPLAQAAAKVAADKLKQQTDDKAAAIVREANERADSLVAAARAGAGKVGGKP